MARGLLDSGAVELGIIATGPVKQFTRSDYRQVKQWIVPVRIKPSRDGLPPRGLVKAVVTAANDLSPDLVHIWGTEAFWGLLPARGLLPYPSLLEMQGLKGECAKVFYGGLRLSERLRCIWIKELLFRRTMRSRRREYAGWGLLEREIIQCHRFVDVQTRWVLAHVKAINPNACLFPVDLALREAFRSAAHWREARQPTILCTAASPHPYKGLHVAIRALGVLKRRVPHVRLRLAGAHQRPGIRQEGYVRWLNRIIHQSGLTDAVDWLGPLNADQIVAELQHAAVVVVPTFIENCCTAMQEAMAIGTPVVASYAGGIPSLGEDEESCLFFPPGDEAMCAYQLERVLADHNLALRLSQESRKIAMVRNDHQRIVQRQLSVYRQAVEASRQ